jgi:uncharacterized membrane protein YhaH (DUF805 family)
MDDIDWQYLLFDFTGRINRGKFWLGAVLIWAVLVILGTIAFAINSTAVWLIFAVAYIGVIWAGLALSIKRWHDRDKSGWWVLIGFVPIIGALWSFIETGFLEGTTGDNAYGRDPLADA